MRIIMYVYICIYIYICISSYLSIYIYMYVCVGFFCSCGNAQLVIREFPCRPSATAAMTRLRTRVPPRNLKPSTLKRHTDSNPKPYKPSTLKP